ncbi:MAG: hypothetical protein AAFR98_11895 [Pseudomonadota bacterium]
MTLVLGIYQTDGVVTPVNTTPPSISRNGNIYTAVPGVWNDAGTISGQWIVNGEALSQTALSIGIANLQNGSTVLYRETTLGVVADSNVITISTAVNITPPSISESGGTATATPGVWENAGTITGEWGLNGFLTGITTPTYDVSGLSNGDSYFYRETTLGVEATSNLITVASAFPTTWVASAASTNIEDHQGVQARTNGEFTTFDDATMTRWTSDWRILAANNTPSFDMGQQADPGFILPDAAEWPDGYIYMHRYDALWRWDAETLVHDASYAVAVTPDGGYASHAPGPVANMMYCVRFEAAPGATYIRQFDLTTGAVVQDIPLSSNIIEAQGITYAFGKFYITGTGNDIYEVETDGTNNGVIVTIPGAEIIEGISNRGDSLYVLFDDGSDSGLDGRYEEVMRVRRYTSAVTQTTGQTSGNWVQNPTAEQLPDQVFWQTTRQADLSIFRNGGAGGGGVGAQDDSDLANRSNSILFQGGAFSQQVYEIPQEAWDSVDAGNATIEASGLAFGSDNVTYSVILYDDRRTELTRTTSGAMSPGFTTWQQWQATGFAVPAGTRSMFFVMQLEDSNAYADDASCVFNW